jgi:DNA-binding HxlR family transcriptional regulator
MFAIKYLIVHNQGRLTVAQVKQKEGAAAHAGTQALSLLSLPLNAALMQALAVAPRSLSDLRREVDSPPQTTMRAYLRTLTETGVVEKHRCNDFPGNVEYQMADSGRELLAVADVLSAWLARFPEAPTAFGTGAARSAIKALVDGWSTSMVRALASRPLSLTELDSVIASVSYPSLERRLGAMRLGGLVEPLSSQGGRGTSYGVSAWLRMAIAPLVAAARWEHRRIGDGTPAVTNRDVEAAFLLALPLLRLPPDLTGSCRLGVRLAGEGRGAVAGVVASVRAGKVEACETRLERQADAWILGTTEAWFATVIERASNCLTIGGDAGLAKELVGALHGTLFGAARR